MFTVASSLNWNLKSTPDCKIRVFLFYVLIDLKLKIILMPQNFMIFVKKKKSFVVKLTKETDGAKSFRQLAVLSNANKQDLIYLFF